MQAKQTKRQSGKEKRTGAEKVQAARETIHNASRAVASAGPG